MSQITFSLVDAIEESLKESINAELRRYNREQNPVWYALRDGPQGDPRPLNVVALDPDQRVVGGLIAETLLAWLKVSIVSVRSDCRRMGIGSSLMALADEEAIRRGCKYAFLDTMDYQAPAFYEKLGYFICGRVDDWDSHGHAKFFMRKNLMEDRMR